MKVYPKDTRGILEFDKICSLVQEKCLSDLGKAQVDDIRFHTDLEILDTILKQVAEFKDILNRNLKFPSQGYVSIESELHYLETEGFVLSEEQFVRLRQSIETIRNIYKFFLKHEEEFDSLRLIMDSSFYEKELLEMINDIIDEHGTVRSDASAELQSIRSRQNRKRVELDKAFRKIVSEHKKSKKLTDTIESVRNGRRVLSVVAEHKKTISGIIHDESDTGKTSFIEPEACVQINNDIFELEREERREIYKILKELTAKVSEYRHLLAGYQEILGSFDFIRAKALVAIDLNASYPTIKTQPTIKLINAVNPILYLHNKPLKKETVPLNVHLNHERRILIISGPNAGGKSVSLKTIGLCQMMLQAGMLIPVDENSEIGIFRQLFTDIGDSQSIEDELSTYSSRLKKMTHFLKHANDRTLFLIDEFGSGTDPQLGGAVAEAILDELNNMKSYGVITTHYANLKIYADSHKHIVNGSMVYDEVNLAPAYKLEAGKPGSSYTFAIAKSSGLPGKVIFKAKKLVDDHSVEFESLLSKVKKDKQQLEKQTKHLEHEDNRLKKLMQKFERLNKELEEQQKRLKYELKLRKKEELQAVEEKVNAVLKEIKESKKQEETARQIRKKLQDEKENVHDDVKTLHKDLFVKQPDGKIEVGSSVKLIESERIGKVEEIRKNKAYVNFGNIRTLIKMGDLVLVDEGNKLERKPKSNKMIAERRQVDYELDLRGKRPSEALEELETYMDSVLLQDMAEVRIIHGKGTGVLRQLVQKQLRGYKEINEMYHPADEFGGDGVTIAKLV